LRGRSPVAIFPYPKIIARDSVSERGEPISALYEQGRVHHVGSFSTLEDQQCAFTVDFNRNDMGYSPDRVDALV
jgi:phage terminase large subunit-like protein